MIAASYYNATRASYSGVGPGIDISVMSDGCNEELGHFVIESLKVVDGVVTQFHVKFSDLCDGRGPLQGELWYVEDTSPVVAPALNGPGLLLSGSSQYLWDGPSFSLTKKDGVVLTMQGGWGTTGRTLDVEVQAPLAPGTEVPLDMDFQFSAPQGQRLNGALLFQRYQHRGEFPGIAISGMRGSCGQNSGRFFVRDLKVIDDVVTKLDVKFYDICQTGGPVQGELRYVENLSQLMPPALNGPGLSLSGHSGVPLVGAAAVADQEERGVNTTGIMGHRPYPGGNRLRSGGTRHPGRFQAILQFSAPPNQHLLAKRYVGRDGNVPDRRPKHRHFSQYAGATPSSGISGSAR